MRQVAALVAAGALLAGCASPQAAGEAAGSADGDEERGLLTHVLLYVPNRVLDALDPVRFGVQVGPGIGVDAAATHYVQGQFWDTFSVGAGFQTLRSLPVQVGGETGIGAGPVGGIVGSPIPWTRPPGAFRLGFHALLVGAHVSLEPLEVLDIPLGFFFIDVGDDDL